MKNNRGDSSSQRREENDNVPNEIQDAGSTRGAHQENRIYIIEEKNWRIILYHLEFAQIIANYMNLHFLLNQKGPRKF